jgi:hypothetical protein
MSKYILAIDPGNVESGVVIIRDDDKKIIMHGILPNPELCKFISSNAEIFQGDMRMCCEVIRSYGKSIGRDVVNTAIWIGRFVQCVQPLKMELIPRSDVKLFLLGKTVGNDSKVREAVINFYPKTGGGKTPQIGTKKHPGELYGLKSHVWQALAVALTARKKYE